MEESIYGFMQRVDNSLNKVVNTVANTTLLSSRLRKHWRTVLYRLPAAYRPGAQDVYSCEKGQKV